MTGGEHAIRRGQARPAGCVRAVASDDQHHPHFPAPSRKEHELPKQVRGPLAGPPRPPHIVYRPFLVRT
jgi:hypothetical protein